MHRKITPMAMASAVHPSAGSDRLSVTSKRLPPTNNPWTVAPAAPERLALARRWITFCPLIGQRLSIGNARFASGTRWRIETRLARLLQSIGDVQR